MMAMISSILHGRPGETERFINVPETGFPGMCNHELPWTAESVSPTHNLP